MTNTKRMTLAALFLAIGYVLPIFTGQIQVIGQQLLPMHFPVFLCGLICGWQYGLLVGLILPITRSLFFGMPPMYPVAIAMAFELATYGAVCGVVWKRARYHCLKWLYIALISAMLAGRIIWGIVDMVLLSVQGSTLTLTAFMAAAFGSALPGIIAQLIFIPMIMVAAGLCRVRPVKEAERQF